MERTYVGPPFADAKVHDAMRVGVITCRPQTRLSDVARMMLGYDVHSIVIADIAGNGGSWGIVTTLDLARAAEDLETLNAGDVASDELVTIPSDSPLSQAAELMAEHGVSHLVAVDPDTERPTGVISARSLAAALAQGR
jgi:CBS domain-containing protein